MRLPAHEVHTKATDHIRSKPTVKFLGPRDDASAFVMSRKIRDNKKVKPTNFQKWVKKFKSLGDP